MENPGGTGHSGKELKMKSALRPWEEYLPPFHVCGKLWHVGDGLLLLDTGYPKTAYLLIQNIHELGFDPRKIRWILHSHGHIDHMGATRALVELTGAKTYIGVGDREIVNGTVDLTSARELNTEFVEPFEPDVLIRDGDVLTFGAFTFRCLSTPGHTPGVISYFFELEENGVVYRAGMHGGVGFKAMSDEFLRRYGLSTECRTRPSETGACGRFCRQSSRQQPFSGESRPAGSRSGWPESVYRSGRMASLPEQQGSGFPPFSGRGS